MNQSAIDLLERHPYKIDLQYLSFNPNAIHILEKKLHNINWILLCRNANAIHILEKNVDKINWHELSTNPEIFTFVYDYEKMKSNMDKIGLSHELSTRVLDPDRLERISKTYKITLHALIKIYS
jgi:hypothetical protein